MVCAFWLTHRGGENGQTAPIAQRHVAVHGLHAREIPRGSTERSTGPSGYSQKALPPDALFHMGIESDFVVIAFMPIPSLAKLIGAFSH